MVAQNAGWGHLTMVSIEVVYEVVDSRLRPGIGLVIYLDLEVHIQLGL